MPFINMNQYWNKGLLESESQNKSTEKIDPKKSFIESMKKSFTSSQVKEAKKVVWDVHGVDELKRLKKYFINIKNDFEKVPVELVKEIK